MKDIKRAEPPTKESVLAFIASGMERDLTEQEKEGFVGLMEDYSPADRRQRSLTSLFDVTGKQWHYPNE